MKKLVFSLLVLITLNQHSFGYCTRSYSLEGGRDYEYEECMQRRRDKEAEKRQRRIECRMDHQQKQIQFQNCLNLKRRGVNVFCTPPGQALCF